MFLFSSMPMENKAYAAISILALVTAAVTRTPFLTHCAEAAPITGIEKNKRPSVALVTRA